MSKKSGCRRKWRGASMHAGMILCLTLALSAAWAEPVFKCGNTYTNVPPGQGKNAPKGCVLVDNTLQPKGKVEFIAVDGSKQITVPVGQDGRFWIQGSVNGFPVQFAIDKGATVQAGIAVTENFAARANLIGGAPARIQTAAGVVDGRRIEGVPMTFGPFKVPVSTVLVGPVGRKSTDAVLGQELLSLFDITANDREMTIASK
ncbi:TIGR02281 family clan AA aspartic protease [Variovorax sp. J22R115]|uniref:retropepsin-like aspartic protease family protein n=1 Tax=Variovorax sp. J22R115 TaxID=3053509 RepID=UPI0025779350|nr:retropepsin-like aspartic protease [Variovorax sp. J22R115]MDM0049620.1 retropepsin-like aspartic protease [Variovorax sp. J22R115]